MIDFSTNLLFISTVTVYVASVWMHLAKKNSAVVNLYVLQSTAVSVSLTLVAIREQSLVILAIAAIVAGLKMIVVPRVFYQIISRHKLTFLVSSYLNGPLTLLAIAVITVGVINKLAQPLLFLDQTGDPHAVPLLLAAMAVSLFLVINRKGAISQIMGILSLENSITAIAVLAGLEQSPTFQVGILFEILIWVIIAGTFLSLMYRHFGDLDTSVLRELRE